MKRLYAWTLALIFSFSSQPAFALDVEFSGFGTIGFAVSDQTYNFQRFVNNRGTFYRDSVVGAHVDVKLNNEFSLTVQGKVAPSTGSDTAWEPSLTWAFLSWRPSNDWLIRGGRIRAPFYLHSQNMEVGATYDLAQLPLDVYATEQANDGDGILVSKTWNFDANELILEGYFGTAEADYRTYYRDGVPAWGLFPGSHFGTERLTGGGLILTLHRGDDIYRMGMLKGNVRLTDGNSIAATYPYVSLGSGVGYYQISGPGVPTVKVTHATVYSLGADVAVGYDFRVMGEYALRDMTDITTAASSQGAYLAILRPIAEWTPYLSLAWMRSLHGTYDLYNKLNNTTVPNSVPNANLINASQRLGADSMFACDQYTVALGTSYQLNPRNKIKAEWARTQTGAMSSFIEAPPGGQSGHKVVNVFSISYNFVF